MAANPESSPRFVRRRIDNERVPYRIGLIVPSVNVVLEPDFHRTLPSKFSTHSHRLWVEPHTWSNDDAEEEVVTRERLGRMNRDLDNAVRYLATAGVDIFVYGCTSGTFFRGSVNEDRILRQITTRSGRPAVAATAAMMAALKALGARRVSVATPYPSVLNARLERYLSHAGLEVLVIRGDPRTAAGSHSIAAEAPSDIARFAEETCVSGTDAIICPCTAWRALDAIADLEHRLGIPVVTANQAMLWLTCQLLAVDAQIDGHGVLFQKTMTA